MTTLIFATNNEHKVSEIQSLLPKDINVITLQQAGINIDIPEPYDTLQENANTKAKTIFEITKQNCFSEDTGLEIDALNGAPGVHSARYASEDRNFNANIEKVLTNLKNTKNRSAQFRTVICLIWEQKEYYFEGVCRGQIAEQNSGTAGFGYDPIFTPEGATKSFAEMTMDEKNTHSHRKKAVTQLFTFLQSINKVN
ncbi:MAG: RdgB/HAM1 family non-canonical purine NTP pyrophosphatase [Chitinophagia bacterium]|jgi:XTP/dITP diphosphohydrolase|nr:RdgB/HAM1 family non-canonical purine NTP pyrophosphatase [Chitinophagia bacterium]